MKRFNNIVKERKQLFSTFEPINNFEARYKSIISELSNELDEIKQGFEVEQEDLLAKIAELEAQLE